MLTAIGDFLKQWMDNLEFIYHDYHSRYDVITFPLTADHHGPWALLPKSKKAKKAMRGMKRIMGPQQCYNFFKTHSNICGTGPGFPGPRNREEALIATGSEAEADFWVEENRNRKSYES